MIVGKIENGLERHGFVKDRLNCLLITDPVSFKRGLMLDLVRLYGLNV